MSKSLTLWKHGVLESCRRCQTEKVSVQSWRRRSRQASEGRQLDKVLAVNHEMQCQDGARSWCKSMYCRLNSRHIRWHRLLWRLGHRIGRYLMSKRSFRRLHDNHTIAYPSLDTIKKIKRTSLLNFSNERTDKRGKKLFLYLAICSF